MGGGVTFNFSMKYVCKLYFFQNNTSFKKNPYTSKYGQITLRFSTNSFILKMQTLVTSVFRYILIDTNILYQFRAKLAAF
jgi:hypothetical protein